MALATGIILDAIVLAFSRSAMRTIVGTDALRTTLDGLASSMVTAETLKLQPLWDLLESQPGFVANDAAPPILRLKLWQPKLERIVELPAVFGDVTEEQIATYAAECKVPLEELEKVLAPPRATASVPPLTRAKTSTIQPRPKGTTIPPRPKSSTLQPVEQKRAIPWRIIAMIAAGAVVVAILLVIRGGAGTSSTSLGASDVSAEIPLANVRQSGNVIGATLTEVTWLGKPEAIRRKQLEDALAKIRQLDATGLLIYDSNGRLVASATNRRKLIIAFPGMK